MSISKEQFDSYRKKFVDLVTTEIDLDVKRLQETDAYLMPINDFVVYYKSNTVNVKNIKWITCLKYKAARVWMDFSQQYFEFHFYIDDLKCAAEYSSMHFVPGTCCFAMPDIYLDTRVGYWSSDDTFIPYSHDFDFNMNAMATDLQLECNEEGADEFSQRAGIEVSSMIWYHFKRCLMKRFILVIEGILRKFTFKDIFEAESEIVDYRTYEMGRRQTANSTFDYLLEKYIAKALTKPTIPLYGVFELNEIVYTIEAESTFRDFRTLKRVGDATWFAYQHHRVFAMVKFEICQFDFTDCLITGLYDKSRQIGGKFVMSPYYNNMFLRFAMSPTDPEKVNLILEVMDLEFQYGLPETGSKLTPVLSEVLPFMQGHVRYIMFNLLDQVHVDYPIIEEFNL